MPRGKQDPPESRDPRENCEWLTELNLKEVHVKEEDAIEFVPVKYVSPKHNLNRLVMNRFGSYKAFEGAVGFAQVGEMVKGNRRISNEKLLKAASVLQVSPLYLLDLTDSMRPVANEVNRIINRANVMRKAIASDLAALNDADLTRKKTDYYFDQEEFLSIGFLGESVTVFLELVENDSDVYPPLTSPLDIFKGGPEDINPEYARLASMPRIQNIRGDYRDLNQLAQDMLAMYPDTLAALLAQPPM